MFIYDRTIGINMGISHRDLAEQFARGATKGNGSRMFITDDTIFSYGYHFPIARRIGLNRYLFNSNSYSPSTENHKRHVRMALSFATLIHVKDCEPSNAQLQIEQNLKQIEKLRGKIKRARKERWEDIHRNTIAWLYEQNELLKTLQNEVVIV